MSVPVCNVCDLPIWTGEKELQDGEGFRCHEFCAKMRRYGLQ